MDTPSLSYTCMFVDLDRTLLAPGDHLSPHTFDVLEAAAARGMTIVPCSGRALNSLPDDLFRLKGVEYAVTSNGVAICNMKTRETIESCCLPPEVSEKLLAFVAEHAPDPKRIHYECFINGQGYTGQAYWDNPAITGDRSYRIEYIQKSRIPVPSITDYIIQHRHTLDSFDIIASFDQTSVLFPLLKTQFPEVYLTNSEPFLVEVSHIDSGKHRGMERFCRRFGFSLEQVVAFGDGNNDVEMLETAGLGIAVANASDTCKAAADLVLDERYDQDAVAHWLEKMLEL